MRTSNPAQDRAFSFPKQLDPKIPPIDYLAYLKDEIYEKMNSSFEQGFTTDVLQKLREKVGYALSDKQLLCLRRMVEKYKIQEHIDEGYLMSGYASDTASTPKHIPSSTKMRQANDDYEDDIPF